MYYYSIWMEQGEVTKASPPQSQEDLMMILWYSSHDDWNEALYASLNSTDRIFVAAPALLHRLGKPRDGRYLGHGHLKNNGELV